MFTPPPSPAPFLQGSSTSRAPAPPAFLDSSSESSRTPSPAPPDSSRPHALGPPPPRRPTLKTSPNTPPPPAQLRTPAEIKKRAGWRTKWLSLLLVPLALVLITASTRVLTHPALLDLLSPSSPAPAWSETPWRLHARHPDGADDMSTAILFPSPSSTVSVSTSPSSASGSGVPDQPTPTASTGTPTIPPDTPPPALPTPFPQALDTLMSNFSSLSCANFFTNMTETAPFRSCRPFSLLLGTSEAFSDARKNSTLMNSVLWGTCHTTVDEATCGANMDWFAGALRGACTEELAARNAAVVSTLTGLLAYPLMRQTACLASQSTSTYCYLSALSSTPPSDTYLFSLPLGTPFPAEATPSCSACATSLLALYADAGAAGRAAGNGTAAAAAVGRYDALRGVYKGAKERVEKTCGSAYQTTAAAGALPASSRVGWGMLVLAGVAAVVVGW